MATSTFITKLEDGLGLFELLINHLASSHMQPSEDQYHTLKGLSLRLSQSALDFSTGIQAFEKQLNSTEPPSEEARKLLLQGQASREAVISTSQLNKPAIFAKNIKILFDRQTNSIARSSTQQAREKLTRKRCERICTLGPSGVISWALAFTPSAWAPNVLPTSTFEYLLKHITPRDAQLWPPEIYNLLKGLKAEDPLRGSLTYHEFLEGKSSITMKESKSLMNHSYRWRDEQVPTFE